MSVKLPDLPLDILLELAKQLDLSDSLHLAATCTACAVILHSASFWIESLHRLENIHQRPIPCPPGTDITSLSLDALRNMAVHAYKLRKNWESDSPLLAKTRSFKIADEGYVSDVFAIEGTHIVVTVLRHGLACWSTISGECLGRCDLDSGKDQNWPLTPTSRSSVAQFAGGCSLGFVCYDHGGKQPTLGVSVISVYHRDPEAITVSLTFSRNWPFPDSMMIQCIIVNENAVGVVMFNRHKDDDPSCLLYCRIAEPQELHCLALDIQPASEPRFSGVGIGGDFVVCTENSGPSVEFVHTTPTHQHSARLDIPASRPDRRTKFIFEDCHMRPPTYGIINVTLRLPDDELAHHVLFWPAEYSPARDSTHSSLTVSPVCSYQHTRFINHIVVSSSGTSVLVRDLKEYVLLQYIPGTTPHVESRRLPIPAKAMRLREYDLVALDDRLGVVYLFRKSRNSRSNPEESGTRFTVFEFA
ncbi:hypothetical protein FB45DRAFT_942861 [Roridomyces roridus]|uniref:F-box domain-containing protein n=1 Tax=Roridomyces roridus TaxID=1738132 RepID=A0AAD7B4W7_9AGAR|nr:hypothetical protein FB45DRAFT_942861 [Roridomyces roridus]